MNCPKCKLPIDQCGELNVDGLDFAVFICENQACNDLFELDGKSFPAGFTFIANQAGELFNPETMEPIART